MSVREAVAEGESRMKRSPAIDHWPAGRERWEAESLAAFVLGLDDSEDLDPDDELGGAALRRYRALVRRRCGGEPMAHIMGYTEFRDLRIPVRPGTFVPRQSSEYLVETAVRRLARRREPIAVDLATGIGPIALAIADAVPHAEVHGTDLTAEAVRDARRNARVLGLRNVTFHRGDLFGGLPRRLRDSVDVLTLHPPYVPKGEVGDLPIEIRGFEPEHVLTDFSEHGLGLVGRAVDEGPEWLRPSGWLLIEVSPDRARPVKSLMQRAGFRDVRSTKGWPEVTRVLAGRRP